MTFPKHFFYAMVYILLVILGNIVVGLIEALYFHSSMGRMRSLLTIFDIGYSYRFVSKMFDIVYSNYFVSARIRWLKMLVNNCH